MNTDRPSDQAIKKDHMAQPILSDKLDFGNLLAEYAENPVILNKIQHLIQQFSYMRTTRRDGNCFYRYADDNIRAFAFRFAELLKADSNWARERLQKAIDTKQLLLDAGYDLYAIEDFHEMFVETLKAPLDQMISNFQTEYISDTIVCFLKLVTIRDHNEKEC